jgi:beta-galactosidase
MFGTPTATFPALLVKKHPSILSVDIDGNVQAFGGLLGIQLKEASAQMC